MSQNITHLRIRVDPAWTPQAIERARAFDLAKHLARDLTGIDVKLLPYLQPIFERLAPESREEESNRPAFVVLPELVSAKAYSDVPDSQGKRIKPRKCTLALMCLHEHPDWTDAEIAAAVGCDRASLYRMKGFKKAKEAMRTGREAYRECNQGAGYGDDD